jgi:hypothetical protein
VEVMTDFILGMDIVVFLAWIGTILATILCIGYGLYYQYMNKAEEKPKKAQPKEKSKLKEEDP